jgi:nucleoside-diphosphate-sugar epimerase
MSMLSIRDYFAGKTVLVTGSTGFLGKALVEKLLRSLPELGQIYLLIRPHRESDGSRLGPQERLQQEILRNGAFRSLRERLGDGFSSYCSSKITCVEGDLAEERLGLDEEQYGRVASQIQVIIHSAATVVFDERLDLALNLNTLGPSRLLTLARTAGAIYVHISTAYVSGMRTGAVPEAVLSFAEAVDAQLRPGVARPGPQSAEQEIENLQALIEGVKADYQGRFAKNGTPPESKEAEAELHRALVQAGMHRAQSLGWNDAYTFTKFLGEQVVYRDRGTVPTVIVRPSIIESALNEPEPGWMDGFRMADPIIIGFGKGRLPDFPVQTHIILDLIPADYVVNAVLAAAAKIGRSGSGFELYTVASSSENPMRFSSLYEYVRGYYHQFPFADKFGQPIAVPDWKFPSLGNYRRKLVNRYLRPARLANGIANGLSLAPGVRKWRSRLRARIAKLEQHLYYVDLYGPYLNLDCHYETGNTRRLLQSIDPRERTEFDFDARKIDWKHYLQDVHIPGLKRHILRSEAGLRSGAGAIPPLEEASDSDKKIPADVGPGIRETPRTLLELCRQGHERFGPKTFLEIRRSDADLGAAVTRISFSELFERAGVLGKILIQTTNLRPGDRVVLLGENCPEWGLAYMAIARAGGTAVPLDRTLATGEVMRLSTLVGAQAIVTAPKTWQGLAAELGGNHGLPPVLNLMGDFEGCGGQSRRRQETAREIPRL